jgi:voltage-gated potassium channel
MDSEEKAPAWAGYQLFMLVLCLMALGFMAARVAGHLDPETLTILDYADYVVCGLFFIDFLISLIRAPDRVRYFITWGWIDLLSSIPVFDFTRWGRIARVLRIFRVLRAFKATRILTVLILNRRTENSLLAAGLTALLLIIFCSIAVLQFETTPEANIKTAEDAVWWALTTITTVGYGDRYPVTAEGRVVAAVLMCGGVGLFGALSGLLAAWFISPAETAQKNEIEDLRAELAGLREAIDKLSQRLVPPESKTPPPGSG